VEALKLITVIPKRNNMQTKIYKLADYKSVWSVFFWFFLVVILVVVVTRPPLVDGLIAVCVALLIPLLLTFIKSGTYAQMEDGVLKLLSSHIIINEIPVKNILRISPTTAFRMGSVSVLKLEYTKGNETKSAFLTGIYTNKSIADALVGDLKKSNPSINVGL
jgi:hypothetical protein